MAAALVGGAGAVAPPPVVALPAPSTSHVLTRVTIPGLDPELDYVAVDAGASIIKAFPKIDWEESSALVANTRAAPLLVIAGVVCLPGHVDDLATPAAKTILDLAEVTAIPSLAFVERCADTCDSLGLFSVPLDTTVEFKNKLLPALARTPAPALHLFISRLTRDHTHKAGAQVTRAELTLAASA